MCNVLVEAMIGVCCFGAVVAVLSVPWIMGTGERD